MTLATTADAPVAFSKLAVEKIQEVLTQENRAGDALRVFIAGMSCSGPQYGMGIESEAGADDTEFVQHGLRVIIDRRSLEYMTGASVEYVEDPNGGGFKIDNPNATGGCSSCGSSGSCSSA